MPAFTSNTSLAPYTGPFERAQAQHLLKRCTFGVDEPRINEALTLGLSGSITKLFEAPVDPGQPINVTFAGDPNVPIGASWVTAPILGTQQGNMYRGQSFNNWFMKRFFNSGFNIAGRMTKFWMNHFSVPSNVDDRAVYSYQSILWDYATGNFQDLIKTITVEVAMLKFLNGNQNRRGAPNENYARELLELFTLGKGEQVGSGDYTTYTEDDIRAIANALTGWQFRNMNSSVAGELPESYFNANRHDTEPRQLSARFDNKVLTVAGDQAYIEVIDTIFEHPKAAHYLCRKLYRFFVYYEIDATIEADIIEPLAQTLVANNFEVAPVIQQLLSSEHFFQEELRGALIKSPLDLLADVVLGTRYPFPDDAIDEQEILNTMYRRLVNQQMDMLFPPSVAGFKAWHQAPQYNRMWINSPTLAERTANTKQIVSNGFSRNGTRYRADLVSYIEDIPNAADPNELIKALSERFLGEVLSQAHIDFFKSLLIPGLPDFEWTVEYNEMLSHPDDLDMRASVERKLADVTSSMFDMPEIHLF